MHNSYESKYYELKHGKSRAFAVSVLVTVVVVFLVLYLLFNGLSMVNSWTSGGNAF